MDRNKYFHLEIANLEIDSKIGKDRHFAAADRKNNRRIALGLFSVIGTAIIASKAIKDIFSAIPIISQYEAVFVSIVSLLVGVSTAILGFLGLEKQVAQHRLVGNMYIEVSRKARRLINRLHEGEDVANIKDEFNSLLAEYISINKEGESCPTSEKDSRKSLNQNFASRTKIKGEIKRQDDEVMQLRPQAKKLSLRALAMTGVKRRFAQLLCLFGIIADADKDEYLRRNESNS